MKNSAYLLPQKISTYMRRLEIMYRNYDQKIFHEIICNSAVYIREAVDYDNWDGGITGHAVILFVGDEILSKIGDFEAQGKITEKLQSDFSECSRPLAGEYIARVSLELFDENDPECQAAINPFTQPIINPESLSIWKPGHLRLFICHRDEHKRQATTLATYLETYGISSFVAHDNIEPLEEWQHTIRKALQTMDILLAFVTDDFFDSVWTNQEIGFAIGRGVPVIPVKFGRKDPMGFISILQAMPADLDSPLQIVDGLYKLLCEKLGHEERIRKATVQAFVSSPDFIETKIRFERLKTLPTLTEADIQQIIEGFEKNPNLHGAFYLTNEYNRFINFLENRTGKRFEMRDRRIVPVDEPSDDNVPF